MAQFAMGIEAMMKLAKLLGLEDKPLTRMVIDIRLDGAVTVVTSQYMPNEIVDEVIHAVMDGKPMVTEAKHLSDAIKDQQYR